MEINIPKLQEVQFDEKNFMEDLKSKVTRENFGKVILVPINKALDAVDAFMLPNICFQMTIQQKGHHIAATNNFKNMLDVIRDFIRDFCKENQIDIKGVPKGEYKECINL